jgi:hypothetical protein
MAISLGTISVTPINSRNAQRLSKDALALIAEIKALENKFNLIIADSVQFGMEKRKENEGDLELLGRIAKAANLRAHELAAEEDQKKVDLVIAGESRPARRGLAGILDKAADKVARF